MSAARLVAALLSFLLGTGAALCLEPARRWAKNEFLLLEPRFSAPLTAPGGTLRIRRDVNGKGYFGASRNGRRRHQGVDLLVPVGDPVFAAKSGRVRQASWQKGYGGVVKISHPDCALTVYAHLSRLTVREGAWIEKGAFIGRAGKSGNASAARILPHLHFEIRYNNVPSDPGRGLLEAHLINT